MLSIFFICLICHLCIFSEMSRPFARVIIGLFAFILLSFESPLYTLGTSLLSDVWFTSPLSHTQVSFPSVAPFHLPNSLSQSKFLNFPKDQFISFSFYRLCLGVKSKNIRPALDLEIFLLQRFLVFYFTHKPVIHFNFFIKCEA